MKNRLLASLLEQRNSDIYSSVRREIEKAFEDHGRTWLSTRDPTMQGLRFKIDVSETDAALEVKAEIPGVDPKDIDVKLREHVLTIKGEKREEKEEEKKDYHITERRYGSFYRSITLPAEVDASKVTATFVNGTLHVLLPKSHSNQNGSKKIPIREG